jgi:hypothetical protein
MIPSKLNSINLSLALLLLLSAACSKSDNQTDSAAVESMIVEVPEPPAGLVEVRAVGLTLQAQDEIPSGWTTLRFINESDMIHFTYLYKVPQGITLDDHKKVAGIFQNFMDEYNGRPHSEPDAGMEIPEWFGNIKIFGGPGLVSAKTSGETTVHLEPGVYFLECYVKTDGIFHSYNSSPSEYGMIHQFIVTGEENLAPEPEATLNVSVSGETGMEVQGEITTGNHMVKVTFPDQKPHENFQGHDIHLVRLSDNSDIEEMVKWMDWRAPTGLQTPAPPGLFLGGTHELPAGGTAYFSVNLEPGSYAFISEVPEADKKGLLVQFQVSAAL